jgi:hypothetical protein
VERLPLVKQMWAWSQDGTQCACQSACTKGCGVDSGVIADPDLLARAMPVHSLPGASLSRAVRRNSRQNSGFTAAGERRNKVIMRGGARGAARSRYRDHTLAHPREPFPVAVSRSARTLRPCWVR